MAVVRDGSVFGWGCVVDSVFRKLPPPSARRACRYQQLSFLSEEGHPVVHSSWASSAGCVGLWVDGRVSFRWIQCVIPWRGGLSMGDWLASRERSCKGCCPGWL